MMANEPVKIEIELNDMETILARALEVSQDLISDVEDRYSDGSPTSLRRCANDTETARWFLSSIPAFCMKYNLDLDVPF